MTIEQQSRVQVLGLPGSLRSNSYFRAVLRALKTSLAREVAHHHP
jgi:NAD(P)H-dependent FMN reductase